jgi:hypothetical protein
VLDRIGSVAVQDNAEFPKVPVQPVVIQSIRQVN